MKNTGYLPSPYDYRNLYSSALPSAPSILPYQYHTDLKGITGVLMQGQQPSCVPHDLAYRMTLYFYEKTGTIVNFNPEFLYRLYIQQNNLPVGSGCAPTLVAKLACDYGCATVATMPINVNVSLEQYALTPVPQAALDEAVQYKIPGYLLIPVEYNAMRQAVLKYKAIGTARRIGKELWTASNGVSSWADKDIDPLRIPAAITGGHMMTEVGWEDYQQNILLNEWSDAWANGGEVRYDFVSWQPFINEAITIAEVPQNYIDLVKTLPPAKAFKHTFTQTLKKGMSGDEIKKLQIALMIDGSLNLDPSIQLGYFGDLTVGGVNNFQMKYRNEILVPIGLTLPTGVIGNQSNKKLNQLFS